MIGEQCSLSDCVRVDTAHLLGLGETIEAGRRLTWCNVHLDSAWQTYRLTSVVLTVHTRKRWLSNYVVYLSSAEH